MVERVTVSEASKRLNISEAAVRQRIHRGSLQSDKDENGRVYVYLTLDNESSDSDKSPVTRELVEEMRERIRFLEDEVGSWKEQAFRKDNLIAQLNQTMGVMASRVPELEAPAEPRESAVTASEEQGKGAAVPHDSGEAKIKEAWWRRIFGISSAHQ